MRLLLTFLTAALTTGCAVLQPVPEVHQHRLVRQWFVKMNPASTWHDSELLHCQYDDGVIVTMGYASFYNARCPATKR